MAKGLSRSAGSFVTKDESGEAYEILVYEEYVVNLGVEMPNGIKRLVTSDGSPVNLNRDGSFTIVESDIQVWKQ